MNEYSRFYIFTGKGGVGKTTFATSFAKHLSNTTDKRVKLVYLKDSKLSASHSETVEAKNYQDIQIEGLNIEGIDLESSVVEYMARKLKSQTISRWIYKAPFFKSLINMLPGFNFVIYIGQILDYLEDDPNLIIVLDAPASGHVLTMLEATQNFSNIFQAGPVYNDTIKILNTLKSPNYLKINIVTLPSKLSFTEATELKESIENLGHKNISILCNNSLQFLKEKVSLPDFLKLKIENEGQVIDDRSFSGSTFPFIPHQSFNDLVEKMTPILKESNV